MAGEQGKAWGGRFAKTTDPTVEAFTEVDLVRLASLSSGHRRLHCPRPDARPGKESSLPRKPGRSSPVCARSSARSSAASLSSTPAREDIHLNIEARLAEKIGDTAGKLHTARKSQRSGSDRHAAVVSRGD